MNPVSHTARTRRFEKGGIVALKDEHAKTGFTLLHDKGHLTTKAAIANCLRHAAAHRHLPEHHAIFIEKVRQLRKRGTWL
ncbi:hypothetical protein HJB72_28420 [Rhizobium lentis]|uniref:hypothetical protein n=1 Tax=Rhizobium lentis TaxID=1138194 RepID=UPI001C83F4B9|nr:hypothetical protein [Rhizobium lentis]MBX5001850.1 hypothetical protein [Rhizobium lentis]